MKLAILNQNYCPLMSYCSETKISRRLFLCNLLKNKIVNAYLNQFFPSIALSLLILIKKSIILVLMTLDLLFQSLILAHVAHSNSNLLILLFFLFWPWLKTIMKPSSLGCIRNLFTKLNTNTLALTHNSLLKSHTVKVSVVDVSNTWFVASLKLLVSWFHCYIRNQKTKQM